MIFTENIRKLTFALRWPLRRPDSKFALIVALATTVWLSLSIILMAWIPGTGAHSGTYVKFTFRIATMLVHFLVTVAALLLIIRSRGTGIQAYVQSIWSTQRHQFITLPLMGLLGVATFAIFMTAYTSIKVRIPSIAPFSWDDRLAAWDAALFLGTDPWRLFEWVHEARPLLRAVDVIYDFWAVLLTGSWTWCFIHSALPLARRLRYCLALIMTWSIGGNLLAIVLSSAGPCYFDVVGTVPDYYSELMAHLHSAAPLRTLDAQEMLLVSYQSGDPAVGGISAMPSMHCATAFLFFLMFGEGRIMRALTAGFFSLIFCSSVILGWHYALDGLVAVLLASVCWWVAGRLPLQRMLEVAPNSHSGSAHT